MMLRIATWNLGEIADAVSGELGGEPETAVSSVSTDTRSLQEGALFVALRGERFDAHDFLDSAVEAGAAAVLVSDPQAVPGDSPAVVVEDTLVALQRLGAALWRAATDEGLHTVCLTGSNGKTTTKELLAAALRTKGTVHSTPGNLNNHIGVPLTLCALPASCDHAVVEIGCNDFGEIAHLVGLAPGSERLVTSIGMAHIEKLGSLDGVRRAKSEIFRHSDPQTVAVVPFSEVERLELDAFPGRVVTAGFSEEADVSIAVVEAAGGGSITEISHGGERFRVMLPIPGRHNAHNLGIALAAILVRGESVNVEAFEEELRRLRLPGGRWRLIRREPFLFVDDAYNANPTSVRASYRAFLEIAPGEDDVDLLPVGPDGEEPRRVAVIGEMLELGEDAESLHAEVASWIANEGGADDLIFVGARARVMALAARRVSPEMNVAACETVEEAAAIVSGIGGGIVFMKASRGMTLERIIEMVAE